MRLDLFLSGIQSKKVLDREKILKMIKNCGLDLIIFATANSVNADSEKFPATFQPF